MIWGRAVAVVNARVLAADGLADRLRFSSRVLSIGDAPRRGDLTVDLDGAFVLPGLINAHDHLELNHYGRIKGRERYRNAGEWIADLRPRLTDDPAIVRGRAYPLVERLFVGALKNLLAGATTVAHHNPFYGELRRTVPVKVVRRYGWAHSFALERQPAGARGEPGGIVDTRWRATPSNAPFMVHLAEGVDDDAAAEFARLESLGCLQPNTVIVHGVAIDRDGWRRAAAAGAGLAWCPASNLFLFGRTVCVRQLAEVNGHPPSIALGTDSRLTGSRDLLDELRVARDSASVSAADLLRMVTTGAADLLRQPHAGRIQVGAPADLVVVPGQSHESAADALLAATRRTVRLIVVDGRPLVGDDDMLPLFKARRAAARPMHVDGASKLGESGLVRRIAGCPIAEPGVTVS